ncbi:MAG: NUDIX domain-containing protein [bacterium]|nr:NUDIX domain-containing protein [bacterium]
MRIVNNKANETKIIYGPAVAVDAVLFRIDRDQLMVLLIKILNGPYNGKWALPGGLVQMDEGLDDAVKRVLFQKANIGDVHLEQLYSFGDIDRDVRGRSVSVAYFALVPDTKAFDLKTPPYYGEIGWWPIKNLPPMAFDHKVVVDYAYERLRTKLEYTNIAYSLLPKEFTLTQLQKIYEIIFDKELDKRNFRKKILTLGLVKETGKVIRGEPHRPAELYQFSKREITFI